MQWSVDDVDIMTLDEEAEELLEIREYMDSLVEEGQLNEDYSLNEDYFSDNNDISDNDEGAEEDDPEEGEDGQFEPEIGIDYWEEGFDLESWEYAFEERPSHGGPSAWSMESGTVRNWNSWGTAF